MISGLAFVYYDATVSVQYLKPNQGEIKHRNLSNRPIKPYLRQNKSVATPITNCMMPDKLRDFRFYLMGISDGLK